MKKKLLTLIIIISMILVGGCFGDDSDDDNGEPKDEEYPTGEYKQYMRGFVIGISLYGKGIDSDFIIIPQNGHELLTESGEEDGSPAYTYINSIDGVGREDLFYGYEEDDLATPAEDRDYMLAFMDIAEDNDVEVLTTDYCWTQSKMDDSYKKNNERGYISFAADERDLNNIPDYPAAPNNVNSDDISSLAEAKNFLYILDPSAFADKAAFLSAITNTNYDAIIMDLFYDDSELTATEIASLKTKANGGTRLVISYMSIGEAEDYRYYWQDSWNVGNPKWLEKENPDWEGNYKVQYWDTEWQKIIYGNDNSYMKKILDAGFDGVYLDIIDAFEYFEE